MAKHIPVPPDLQHLIEKRDQEADRRRSAASKNPAKPERRKTNRRRRGKKAS